MHQLLYGVCPINVPFMSAAECSSYAYALFIGDDVTVTQMCQWTILTNFKMPVLYPGSGHFWIYSMHQSKRVTL